MVPAVFPPEAGEGSLLVGQYISPTRRTLLIKPFPFLSVVPENTEVYVPAFSLHRSPRYFSPCPDIFWPDRWLSKEHTESFNPNAYIPFSYGPANCVGRNLAKREIMMLSSLLIQTFDMKFEEGFDPSTWEEKLHDHLVLTRASLPVVLTPRYV